MCRRECFPCGVGIIYKNDVFVVRVVFTWFLRSLVDFRVFSCILALFSGFSCILVLFGFFLCFFRFFDFVFVFMLAALLWLDACFL